ncbi:WD40-repeat-containing domain protein [Lophiotrema nucula]|uniref:WD40-repeat-containing domain protein n=1 Tax=Lophiotrema nucula TaxID=690887 RepID=A0A6A5YS82_9PLEO|nr:WD40-repeat-containing domain protein [Lophiotrema nucula]
MDIHRSRFVPYQSSAINALAFSHEPENDKEDSADLRLAIGRANGNIEVWNPAGGAWTQERIFYGGKDRSVEGLAWIQDQPERDGNGTVVAAGSLRLFSIGYSSSVTEWDLATGLPLQHSSGNNSEVWCFAAQPQVKAANKQASIPEEDLQQNLVAGCADGSLLLLSTADDELRFDRFISRSSTKKARVLSVTYKDRNTVVAGFADSTIRVFDTRNSTVVRNISLGSGPPGGPKDILVWKVRCLPDGDFVTGDSTGDIRIYDGKSYGQVQRISGHEADVLDLAVSRDGNMIFSGGLDRRTCFYTRNSKKARRDRGEVWRKVSHKRYHEHDIKAMATYEGSNINVLVSGGIDTQPIVIPIREFGKQLSRSLPALPNSTPFISAPEARLIVSWWNCEIRLWRVKKQQDVAEKPKVIGRLALKGDENITSVSITRDGELLAAATTSEVRLFQLSPPRPHSGSTLRIRKLDTPTQKGAKLIAFSADGRWLSVVTPTNDVQVARITRPEDSTDRPRVVPHFLHLRRLRRSDTQIAGGPFDAYNRSIAHVAFSEDGNTLAVADLAGYIDTWVVEGHEDSTSPEVDIDDSSSSASSAEDDDLTDEDDDEQQSKGRATIFGQRWIRNPSSHLLPRLDSPPVLLAFQPRPDGEAPVEPNGNPAVHPTRHNPHPHSRDIPDREQILLAVSAEHQLYLFQVLAGRLSDWCRRNPPRTYPTQFTVLDDAVKGCVWDVARRKERLWLYGEKWLFMFDLRRDFSFTDSLGPFGPISGVENNAITKKRKRDERKGGSKKSNTGAGDAVPDSEAPFTKIRKITGGKGDEPKKSSWVNLSTLQVGTEYDEDGEDTRQALATLRRSTVSNDKASTMDDLGHGDADLQDASKEDLDQSKRREGWWHSLKYRPILGIVPIGERSQPLEVVLAERPIWDLDLPPKFVGAHE